MNPLSTATLIRKRLADDWRLLGSVFLGITVATALVAGAPVYLHSLERLGVETAIDRSSEGILNIFAFGPHIPLDRASIDNAERKLGEGIERDLSYIYRGRRQHLTTPIYLVGLPVRPLLLTPSPGQVVGRGFFQYLEGLDANVSLSEGRMATDLVEAGPDGPVIETVIGSRLAELFQLQVGDSIVLTPSYGEPSRITATLVGIVDAIDPSHEFWQRNASIFLAPAPINESPDAGVEIDPLEQPVALFVTLDAMTNGVGRAYPGTLVTSTWVAFVDKERLKDWSIQETRDHLGSFKAGLSADLPGATTLTGIERLLDNFETRSFFASVPLLLLLAIMVVTVLYYLAMMVSYLVHSREDEVALLRGRGVSTLHLLRIYALEGLVLTVVGVVLAPFIAMGVVAVAGKLPYFHEITAGEMLPVEFQWLPFVVAAGTGLVALAIFVMPRVVGARAGLVVHKLRSSRPPSVPMFHRYYLDLGLMVVGGLIFWELQAKGQLVSGGLFEDVNVNEALLLAPVLFLTVVALLFLRFFPLFVRFIGGESPSLLNLIATATFVSLSVIVVVGDVRGEGGSGWLGPVALVAAAGGVYWLTSRATRPGARLLGLVVQSGLVVSFVVVQPPVSGENAFVPTISLICLVPAQGLFMVLRSSAQFAPVWVSVGLWHMARNPLQYSWLVLLLVMVTGLGLLATTVGGTLDRSHEQRILYDVAADVRVSNMESFSGLSRESLRDQFLAVPGVTAASLVFRGTGKLGAAGGGRGFDLLAVEPQEFSYMSWWRDDFASQPIEGVMRALYTGAGFEPLIVPEGATQVGIWTKPDEAYANVFVWIVVEDSLNIVDTISVGELEGADWSLMRADIPARLVPPLRVLSVQLWEPGFGPIGTPGSVMFDDLHTVGPNGEERILDGFEGGVRWASIPTSSISIDTVAPSSDAFRDTGAVRFTFGKETNRGVRGISHFAASSPVSIAVSTTFSQRTGYDVGDVAIVDVMDRLVPVAVRAKVNLFPTMNPGGLGFVVADLDTLLRHLNAVSPLLNIVPNEALISEAPGAAGTVRDSLLGLPAGAILRDRYTALESVRLDPLVTAGWKAMVVLAVGIILFTAASGYFTYMIAFADRSRAEMGFLRSLGLSRRQMSALLVLEHAVIVVMGLVLGTWSGFEMSVRMVSSVAVTDRGDAVLPPFSLTTDWTFMIPIYFALVAIFGIALYALNRSMRNVDMQVVARLEG